MTKLHSSLTMLFFIFATNLSSFAQSQEQTSAPSDAEIVAILMASNQVDIDTGKMAQKKTDQSEVKNFASEMITDHTLSNKQAQDLSKKLKVKAEPNEASKTLIRDGKETMANLKKLKGKTFDKAYVDHEVAFHTSVLDTLDNTLIPNAKNAELKALLEKSRPTISAHLEHAKGIREMQS